MTKKDDDCQARVPSGPRSTLEQAVIFAAQKHAGQTDKGGHPYILHCLSVMFNVRSAGGDVDMQIAGLLHDALEDTDATTPELVRLFGQHVADLVFAVTRTPYESYEEYIGGISTNRDAAVIKLADLKHNLDPARHGWFPKDELESLKARYRKAETTLCLALSTSDRYLAQGQPDGWTPGPWMKWKLAPDSDPEEHCIVTTADGEQEICGIVYREQDADLIVEAVNRYLSQGQRLEQ